MTVTRSAKERLPRLYTACGNTLCNRRIWRLPGIVSPTAMAKLAIESDSLEPLAINREIGRSSLFYQKSGDLPLNRDTWKLWGRYENSVSIICIAQNTIYYKLSRGHFVLASKKNPQGCQLGIRRILSQEVSNMMN